MMQDFDNIPWPEEDDHRRGGAVHHTEREWKRNPIGMGTRLEWNASPLRQTWKVCPCCGYAEDSLGYNYEGNTANKVCWNCWYADTHAAQLARQWAAEDRAAAGTTKKQGPPKMKTFAGMSVPGGG
jgi:hypothetical protein